MGKNYFLGSILITFNELYLVFHCIKDGTQNILQNESGLRIDIFFSVDQLVTKNQTSVDVLIQKEKRTSTLAF